MELERDTVHAAVRDHDARVRLEAAERLAARGERGESDEAAAAHEEAKRARRAAFDHGARGAPAEADRGAVVIPQLIVSK
ncbi:hypothetical protein ACF1HJ_38770 [Streptomyces sp. NPDC013978]|uniref:hypothetical protein n=1 Tax=Streptomyces sp. NPDC013978 TaxID=3364869 RepID=UPI0036FE1D18